MNPGLSRERTAQTTWTLACWSRPATASPLVRLLLRSSESNSRRRYSWPCWHVAPGCAAAERLPCLRPRRFALRSSRQRGRGRRPSCVAAGSGLVVDVSGGGDGGPRQSAFLLSSLAPGRPAQHGRNEDPTVPRRLPPAARRPPPPRVLLVLLVVALPAFGRPQPGQPEAPRPRGLSALGSPRSSRPPPCTVSSTS